MQPDRPDAAKYLADKFPKMDRMRPLPAVYRIWVRVPGSPLPVICRIQSGDLMIKKYRMKVPTKT